MCESGQTMKCGNSNEVIHKDVVIVGNGPSGITLSYMLSGNIPYVTSNAHPDEFLSARLATVINKSLVHEDLDFLSGGLEGRTTNPVSLLIDNLMHPCADIGLELEPLVEWRNDGFEFKKFGHICEIQKHDYTKFEQHEIYGKYKYILHKVYWKCRKLFLINETNRRGYNFLRSQKKMENEYRKQLLYTFTIHPFSDFRKYWEVFMSFILLVQVYSILLYVAVCNMKIENNFIYTQSYTNLKYIINFISLIDVCLSFLTGYCNENDSTVVMEPKRIIHKYIFSTFIKDLICSIPMELIIRDYEESMEDVGFTQNIMFSLKFLCLVKLCRLSTVVMYIKNFFEVHGYGYLVYRIFIVTVCYITFIHILSCVSMAWISNENPWSQQNADSITTLKSYGPHIRTFSVMYLLFFYSTCLTVLNAGYRFVSLSNASLLFTVNVWIVSRIIFILTLSYFMEVYIVTQSSKQKYIDMVKEVKDCMRHKHLPDFLRKRILAYYEIKYQNYYFQEADILNTVSGQLRQEIVMNTCRKMVESVVFFKNLPLSLLVRIVSCLRYEIFLTNDVIAKAGSPGDSMYFIAYGTVAIYTRFGQEVCHLRDGDHFGEVSLVIKDSNRIASVVAIEICELYRLEKKDFIRAILPYPDLMDKISNIAGDRLERTDIMNEAIKFKISHVVLGKGPPGGSWNSMDPQILTLSLGSWMALPGLPYKSRNGSETRASAKNVADYYKHYVEQMDLTKNFKNHTIVTSIKPYNYKDSKSKWVEKVDSDITKKAKLCSRLEAKEARSCTFSKFCPRLDPSPEKQEKICKFSNAINYLLSRNQKKAREEDFLSILGSDYKCDSCSKEQRKINRKLKPRVPNSSKHCDSHRWLVEAVDLKTKECFTYTCDYLVVANGSSDLPNRLSISDYKTDPFWLLYDLRSLEIELDLLIQNGEGFVDPVLVVGAGLSAADAIIATRGRNVDVLHLFRNKSSTLGKQLPENMYPEYHKVHQMMRNESKYPHYMPLPETTLTSLDQENRTVTLKSAEGTEETFKVSFVVVLIGSKPDMSFLPAQYNIAVKKNQPLDCKTNTVSINKLTHSVNGCEGLYALGPLAGDNFVRFLPGGALAVLSDLYKKYEL